MAGQSQLPKSKLVETAADLIYRQGWNATGINQILGDAKVPKGSFYYYFQSKEDLGVAIVKFHAQRHQECYTRTLLNASLKGHDAIVAFFDEQIALQRRGEWRFGCPIGSFSNEVAATTEKIAAACREALSEQIAAFESALRRGKQDGSIRSRAEPHEIAILITGLWQGALLLAKSLGGTEPVLAAVERIRGKLLGSFEV